ncbi:antitoxin [Enterococcus sp. DIV0180]|uniref:antitoxin n=1 Tax=Enterococcus sp. DIV0180 TaxID=2774749 RepID=UPI003D300DFB
MNEYIRKSIEIRIESLQAEITDLEKTKSVLLNETAKKAIDLHLENLEAEIHRLGRILNE